MSHNYSNLKSGGNDVCDALVNMNSFDGGAGTVATMRKMGPNAS